MLSPLFRCLPLPNFIVYEKKNNAKFFPFLLHRAAKVRDFFCEKEIQQTQRKKFRRSSYVKRHFMNRKLSPALNGFFRDAARFIDFRL